MKMHGLGTLRSLFIIVVMTGLRASAAVTIQTVSVGNPGNANDVTGFGAVNYSYNIGSYDVTEAQYTAFLNSVAQADPDGLYVTSMANATNGFPGIIRSGVAGQFSYAVVNGRANRPMTDVSFWDACRFSNWLENGQPTAPEGLGSTDSGTYTLTAAAIANNTVTRNAGSVWAVSSENEWYKAAYYSPSLNQGAGGYWLYATQSNTISTAQANYYYNTDTTNVGSYPYPSAYGTYDQAGNAQEWTESVELGIARELRGGDFNHIDENMQSTFINYSYPSSTNALFSFRVSEVPEPMSIVALYSAIFLILFQRGRGQRLHAASWIG